MREGLRHLQQRDQVARLPPHLPAGASRTGSSDAAQAGAHRRVHDVMQGCTSSVRGAVQEALAERAKGALKTLRKSSILRMSHTRA